MFAVASIFHDQKDIGIEALFDLLRLQNLPVSRHVWKGLSVSAEQIRYLKNCDVVLQSDEEDFSREELNELVQSLDRAAPTALDVDRLKLCTAKVDILPFQPDATREQYESWLTSGIVADVPGKQLSTIQRCSILQKRWRLCLVDSFLTTPRTGFYE